MPDKESLTGIEQDVQVEERTKHAMETYVNWLQNAMSASPWTNVDLNKKLLGYATDNVAAAVGLVEKLSHAKNLEDVVRIQTEFVSKQLGSLNEQTKPSWRFVRKRQKQRRSVTSGRLGWISRISAKCQVRKDHSQIIASARPRRCGLSTSSALLVRMSWMTSNTRTASS